MRAHLLIVIALLLLHPGCSSSPPPSLPHPNIIIVLADDLGLGDVSYRGSEIQTKNIDRLANDGLILERFYSQPECSPSRAALLTSKHPVRYGMSFSVIRPWDSRGIPKEERLLPEIFQEAGYATALVGKWHVGHGDPEQLPNARGFDHFYGHLNGRLDYFTHQLSHGELRPPEGLGLDWQRNGKAVEEEGYTTTLLAKEASRVIQDRDVHRPLFLLVALNAPHPPLQALPSAEQKFASIQDEKRRTYAAMVDTLDESLGQILNTLDDEKITSNTLLLFLSDNGAAPDKGGSNGSLRGGKATTLEGGIRVPAILRWPAKIEKRRKTEQRITLLDIGPTLITATGIGDKASFKAPGDIDGQDLWATIQDGATFPREKLFFATQHRAKRHTAVIDGGWKLARTTDVLSGTEEEFLYHLDQDPLESEDQTSNNKDRHRALQTLLNRWISLHPPDYHRPTYLPPRSFRFPRDWARATGQRD